MISPGRSHDRAHPTSHDTPSARGYDGQSGTYEIVFRPPPARAFDPAVAAPKTIVTNDPARPARPPGSTPFFSGVLQRMGKDLHQDDPLFAYRALLDRAHDACMRRRASEPGYLSALLVGTQAFSGTSHVSFCDNGVVLAPEDVRQLYATIRQGRTGAVHRALLAGGVDGADDVVGRLGVALLAAFVISDQIAIMTRGHDHPPESGIRYLCNSRTYSSDPHRIPRPGTVIQLRIRPDQKHLGQSAAVRAAIFDHARLLELPVRVGSDPKPINAP